MTLQQDITAASQDQKAYLAARDSNPKDLLVYAAKKSGRSPVKIQREFLQLSRSYGRINMVEYIRNGLYDIDRYSDEERANFLSNDLHWDIAHTCNDQAWSGTAEDKVIAGTILEAGGVPVPKTLAILDKSNRIYPGLDKLSTKEACLAFLRAHGSKKLFGKITGGMVSFGAFRIEGWDAETIHCNGHAPMSYEIFLNDFIGNNAYVLQEVQENHDALAPYASALATVRMVNFLGKDGLHVPVAIIKLPQGDNIADAFWRPGNLACDIDVETGTIRTVTQRGLETEFLEDHPVTAGLKGLQLPFWQQLLEINERAAHVFEPIRHQAADIAITPNGPVMVELNYGGGFDLPQYASGRGLLTPEVRAFLAECGVDLTPRKKKGFFSRK